MMGDDGDDRMSRGSSAEQVSEISVLLNGLLLGLLLLGLLFLGHWGAGGDGGSGNCRDGGRGAEASLSLGDELADGLALEQTDDLVDVLVAGVGGHTAQDSLDVGGGCLEALVLMSFLPERESSA